MKKPYQYAFRENAKGVYTKNDIYVEKGDELEKYIFDKYALAAVKELVEKEILVDIGSGEGRYSRYFGTGFRKVISVEPDEKRYQKTCEGLADMNNVECFHGTANDVHPNGTVNVVINIHVLQHVHDSAVQEILDFAGNNLSARGLLILAMTKRTPFDYPWNIAWQDDKSRYSPVPEQVFEYVTSENVPGVLPVRKEEVQNVFQELQKRDLTIETQVEYAPRFVDQKNTLKGKFFMFLYRNLPGSTFHRLINIVGYPFQEDVLIIARKN